MNLDRYRYVNLIGSIVFLRNDGNELPDDKEPLFRELQSLNEFSSYLRENTLHPPYKDQTVKSVHEIFPVYAVHKQNSVFQ